MQLMYFLEELVPVRSCLAQHVVGLLVTSRIHHHLDLTYLVNTHDSRPLETKMITASISRNRLAACTHCALRRDRECLIKEA